MLVLAEADQADMEVEMTQFGAKIAEISSRYCDLSIADLDGPTFAAATEQYGELLGQPVMDKAMSRMGIQQ